MRLKRLREYLPLYGGIYGKLRKLREDRRKLIRYLHEMVRDRDELYRQLDELTRRLQISQDAALLYNAQSEATRLRFIEFLRLIRPLDIDDKSKIRVGGPHDGGYVMVDDFEQVTTALSIGIGHEISWDKDMSRRGLCIFQFDHTLEAPPVLQPRFRFFKKKVGPVSKLNSEITLADILELEELRDDRNLIMKMDIEGDEWAVLDATSEYSIRRLRQFVIEFHDMHKFASPEWGDRALRVFTKITHTHQVIHVHGNNHNGFAVLGGIPFPAVAELTLVRKDHHTFSIPHRCWPTELDAPNQPTLADLSMGTFEFVETVCSRLIDD
jgi:Methyltransferase FkbM domain